MFPHGAQKALGWFHGYGFNATIHHLPGGPVVGTLVVLAEFVGAIGLVFGFLGRVGAFGIIAVMLGAIALVHAPNGFFMNWSNDMAAKEGYEYHLLAIGMALAVLVRGSGALSIDRLLVGGGRRRNT
jgi:putative oxidoreductase